MQNFITKTKKVIKRVAAVAGSIALASTMIAPVLAASELSDLPAPFISNGEFDANIIIGSFEWRESALTAGALAGLSKDLAGSIDVAAAFAQQAKGEAGSAGTVTLKRPQIPGALNTTSDYLSIGTNAKAISYNASSDGFEWLVNTTLNHNDTDFNVYETLSVNNQIQLLTDSKLQLRAGINYEVKGPVDFIKGTAGFPIFGNTYQIVDIKTDNNVTFGKMTELKELKVGDVVSITGKADVEIISFDTVNNQVKVKVTAKNGTEMFNDFMSLTTKNFNDDGYLFTLKNLRGVSGSYTVDLDWSTSAMELRSGDTAGIIDPSLDKWTMTIVSNHTAGNLTSIKFTSPASYADRKLLNIGDNFEIMNYFNLSFDGWKDLNTTSYSMTPISGISTTQSGVDNVMYTNNASQSISIILGGIKNGETDYSGATAPYRSRPTFFLTTDDEYILDFSLVNNSAVLGSNFTNNLTIRDAATESTILANISALMSPTGVMYSDSNLQPLNGTNGSLAESWVNGTAEFETNGATYNLTYVYANNKYSYNISLVSFTAGNNSDLNGEYHNLIPEFNNALTWSQTAAQTLEFTNNNDTMSGTLTVTEGDSESITVTYKDNTIDELKLGSTKVPVGTELYSSWGTAASRSSGSVDLTYPETRRYADAWIGRKSVESKEFVVGSTIDGTTWEVSSVGAGGSAAVNAITPGIGMTEESLTGSQIAKPSILVGGPRANKLVNELSVAGNTKNASEYVEGTALIQLIDNAFGTGNEVLIIAGYAAEDTLTACRYISAVVAGQISNTLTGMTQTLNTASESYTTVSILE